MTENRVGARHASPLLFFSGLSGFLLGIAFDEWQVAVETAQVLAGLVAYPPDNPFFIYHVKVWSILHQISALLLRLGVSEAALSVAISGVLGMLSFQGLALGVYAIGRDAVTAIGAVFVIFVSRAAEYGVVYPIWLVGTIHTYGVLGLAWCVVSLGLAASGSIRAGAVMLGLAPAIHPSIGAWFAAVVLIAIVWGRADLGPLVRRAVPYFLTGAVATTASLIVRLILTPDLAPVDPAVSHQYLTSFIGFWDGHRRPVELGAEGLWLNLGAVVMALVWLTWFARDLTAPSRLLLRVAAVSGIAGALIALVSQIPIDRLPLWFVVLMPSRLLNLNGMIFAAMLFGVLSRYRHGWYGQAGLLVLGVGLLLSPRAMGSGWLHAAGLPDMVRFVNQLGVMVIAGLLAVMAAASARRGREQPLPILRWTFVALCLAAASATAMAAQSRRAQPGTGVYRDRSEESVLAAARRDRGMLLTGGDMQLIQLRTRRPVLIDGGGLDGLVYAPESAPAVERVLREVYGIDLLHPPDEARDGGRVPVDANRTNWEQYSFARWQAIGRTFGITQVMTHNHWQLQLPVVARSQGLVLYAIPE